MPLAPDRLAAPSEARARLGAVVVFASALAGLIIGAACAVKRTAAFEGSAALAAVVGA